MASTLLYVRALMADAPDPTEHDQSFAAEEIFREPASSLNIELTRISEEILSINSGFQDQVRRALEEVRDAVREEVQKELSAELERRTEKSKVVQAEIQRVMIALDAIAVEISKMIDDPAVELSRVIRRKSQQAELKAYLEGLRFGI